jgi:ABC-type branched-subunit amino acid transport system substrate-binding protein
MSPSATATQLGEVDRTAPGLLWRTAPPDGFQASVLVNQMLQPPAATALVVVRRANDVYAQSLSVLVQEAATRAGVRVDASQVFADGGALPSAAAMAIASSPDAVLFLSSELADTAAFLDATAALSTYDGVTIYVADVAANDDLVALTTTGARRFPQLRATRPAPPSTIITSEFASEYASANGGSNPLDHSFTAHTYDATALTLLGIGYAAGAGDITGVRIAEGLRLVSAGTHEYRLLGANLPAIIAAMRAPSPDVNVVGASGALDFDPSTEELTSATYQVLGVDGTPPRFTVLRTIEATN